MASCRLQNSHIPALPPNGARRHRVSTRTAPYHHHGLVEVKNPESPAVHRAWAGPPKAIGRGVRTGRALLRRTSQDCFRALEPFLVRETPEGFRSAPSALSFRPLQPIACACIRRPFPPSPPCLPDQARARRIVHGAVESGIAVARIVGASAVRGPARTPEAAQGKAYEHRPAVFVGLTRTGFRAGRAIQASDLLPALFESGNWDSVGS
jgi:hypothetical protein